MHLSLRVTEVPKKVLKGKIALVAGVTRGAGRWIAIALGEAGATVLPAAVHGDGPLHPETIEETAKLVTAAGGRVSCEIRKPPRAGS